MRHATSLVVLLLIGGIVPMGAADSPPIALVVHGGAGDIERGELPDAVDKAYREQLATAAKAGYEVLAHGGSSLDAVQAVITPLEDSPLFNAGKGAVFADDGANELDASLMDGDGRRAGAVAAVRRVKNPIALARLVMEKSPHVLLVATGAEDFAVEQGMALVDPSYFFTEGAWRSLQAERAEAGKPPLPNPRGKPHGTVGCVALDAAGHLAAGTSTGGLSNKHHGRVGDSPIIGAGTWADDATCAISCTGHGEDFIRAGVARDVAALVEYKGLAVGAACEAVLAKLPKGSGGMIALDRRGTVAAPFTTGGMFRAWVGRDGQPTVKIYRDE